jgi:hypothetical protein
MSSPYSSFFRRRTIGRAASPPTWACYEQIPYDEDDEDDECSDSTSEQDSCSEDGEDYAQPAHDSGSDREEEHVHTSEKQDDCDGPDVDMEIDEEGAEDGAAKKTVDFQKDVKGKQRAIEPQSDSPKKRHPKKRRERVFTLRPILTIQRSQGFVWNQVSPASISRWETLFIFYNAPGPICSAVYQR